MDLAKIKNPKFLKTLSLEELNSLCSEIRDTIIKTVSLHGGHLSSNLGVVELTVALHYVFNADIDKIIFDVSHQTYTHKILTGRYDKFVSSLREYKGLSGYQKLSESEYDCYEAGHSSTSISAACGFAKAKELGVKMGDIITVIGDSSIASGLAFEGLNNLVNLKEKVIIILNDNGMGINKSTGGISKTFTRIRNSIAYAKTKDKVKQALSKHGKNNFLYRSASNLKDTFKRVVVDTTIFENMGLDYLGPVYGHDIQQLITTLNIAKNCEHSVVVHVITTKGKGYPAAENDLEGKWHGVGEFDVSTGAFKNENGENTISWSQVVSLIIHDHMEKDKQIVTISPAMIEGSRLMDLFNEYKDRCIDVGINEEHAFTMASGLILNGYKPFISIYSTFIQRSIDEIIHDVARMKLPLVVGIDRAGLVGKDGNTHQGTFDVALLKGIPNSVIAMPKDMNDARSLFNLAFNYKNLFFIRYPRENTLIQPRLASKLKIGMWDISEVRGAKVNLVITGPEFPIIEKYVKENKLPYNLIFARFYNPIDKEVINKLIKNDLPIIVIDLYSTKEGLVDSLGEYLIENKATNEYSYFTLPTSFIDQGSIKELMKGLKLDLPNIMKQIGDKYGNV